MSICSVACGSCLVLMSVICCILGGSEVADFHLGVVHAWVGQKLLKNTFSRVFMMSQSWAQDSVPMSTNAIQPPLLHKLFCHNGNPPPTNYISPFIKPFSFVWYWNKPPRKTSYKCTFGAPDQGQTLNVWESQTSESALRWRMRHIAPRHILELTLEVILEIILEHVLRIKTMTSLILDHVATAYLYLGMYTGEKVMILCVVIVLELSQDSSWLNKHAPRSSLL